MKFTLKDYQDEAVAKVLDRLKKARRRWHEDKEKNAFSLTAATGAGKTVMAAAVFEALFFGNDDYEFEADPGAVVLWFSDDPSLNEQSKYRLFASGDKLTVSDLITVENTFVREMFEPGKIYFLNTQKLSKNSMLVRGHDLDDQGVLSVDGLPLMPDGRSHTIWDTIQNTIEDPGRTLYLVLDEAHRGMRDSVRGTQTIVTRLINGQGSVPSIPIVLGISATVQRFNDAMQLMDDRTALPNVVVDSALVQESGLLKDTINLDVPNESGDLTTVLLRRGTLKLKESSKAWEAYAKEQGEGSKVTPLMVVQVPNSPNERDVGTWLETIFDTWPDLPHDSVYNVFGEHRTENFSGLSVPYIMPERVQESNGVRILLAKDAISTGWDCPRAEVMVSFRTANDHTHITQLLGRMVRTPLARRIPGNDRLNSVDCLLPKFNQTAVRAVVEALMSGGESGDPLLGRRVLINPVEMMPNPDIPEMVWDKLTTLPSAALPKKQARPIKRLTALAHELALDGLVSDAGKEAHNHLHVTLDRIQSTYEAELISARTNIMSVGGRTIRANVKTQEMSFDDFIEAADYRVIDDAFKKAARIISLDLAKTYSEHFAEQYGDLDDFEESLIEAHTVVASIGMITSTKDELETEADNLAEAWLSKHETPIKALTDQRQDVYRELREWSTRPLTRSLATPRNILQPAKELRESGEEVLLPKFERHLLSDENGEYPDKLNSWETHILECEMIREEAVAWYRNPPYSKPESLGITYIEDNQTSILRPDFIFFTEDPNGNIIANIVDPHGHHLADALPKLKGLCVFFEGHGGHFGRIEAVSHLDGRFRFLDICNAEVRDAISDATSAKSLFEGPLANAYPDVD